MSPFDTHQFKKLKKKWYRKLKKKGFKDIEDQAERLTDHQSLLDFQQRIGFRQVLYESIRDYYYWASDMLVQGKFKCSVDRRIWSYHAMGRSSRFIAGKVKYDQTYVCRKIKKIRRYLRDQHGTIAPALPRVHGNGKKRVA